MNRILQKAAYQAAHQVADMHVDMAEDREMLDDAWLSVMSFFANHDVPAETMLYLRRQLVEAEIQLDPHAAIEKANKRLVLEAKWRQQAEDSRRKRDAAK